MITIVPLRFLPGNKWVHLRELCGNDEQFISGIKSIDAIRLLDGILSNGLVPENVIQQSAKLVISDRDRILAAVYVNTYGPDIQTTVSCSSCNCQFDIEFSLESLIINNNLFQVEEESEQNAAIFFRTSGGARFRLPTGEDEIAVMGMDPEKAERELMKRCLIAGNTGINPDILQQEMQNIAPLIDADFETQCPECSEKQSLHFNLQQYLLSSLLKEQKKLAFEVNQLARAYGWGLNEILRLPRSIRRSYVSMVESN